ncbi:Cysteine--tRNA ligase [Buchnera aphidicola (Cinara kochiana kochiana)]|uniref:Cysteine--tRNA ligase n=1 Tax=Buchnera aphidicola (Cinara kochiana kochiana) TaxID=2518976 RepID=A0A451D5Y4_9GAMM|nr:cysteine--tRNA ligase [Buchnera aphidicola]VFP81216.1 Cysteine--tRNA ligase [Buchnera aphidicola (Cinara kochiana kochiana)]
MLKVFNTLTKKKERFTFLHTEIINIYVCGVTVYDLCHIGHARTFLVFDIIIRYLEHIGYKVFYLRNITDIDDKIIDKANQHKEPVNFFVERMIKFMNEDFLSLNLKIPNCQPRVTECMADIISAIDILLKNKYAYINDNKDVLFSINRYKNYGSLSHRIKNYFYDELISHFSSNLNNSDDFVLWKHNINRSDPFWTSPWGPGRPGWHIECSAIIHKFFKNRLNIHGGGIDLLFPHHENEITQLKSLNDSFSVPFWVHIGMVIINNQKMSKSLSNTIFIRNLLKKYDSEVIRYYILLTHYRHPLLFSKKKLCLSKNILNKIYTSILNCTVIDVVPIDYEIKIRNVFKNQFYTAMNNDFNTPQACSILQKLSQYINKIKKSNIFLANVLAYDLISLGNILGLLYHKPKNFLFPNYRKSMIDIIIVKELVSMRNVYRLDKKWHLADIIRQKLLTLGVIVEDHYSNSTYKFINK